MWKGKGVRPVGTNTGERVRGFKIPMLYRGEQRDASTNNTTRNRLLRNAILNHKKTSRRTKNSIFDLPVISSWSGELRCFK